MKKLLVLLLLAIPAMAQINLMNNTVKIGVTGDIKYGYIHAVGSADSVSVALTVAQNVYTKMVIPGFSWKESGGMTCAADSARVLTAGDYVINMSVTLSGTNANDFWRIKMYKNNAAFGTSVGRFVFKTTTNNVTDTRNFFWYLKDLAINDVLTWHITNLTASRNPTVTDLKLFIEKKPE